MIVKRNINFKILFTHGWPSIVFAFAWTIFIFGLYHYVPIPFRGMPFEPISVIGIAVSFLIGFKNNQSYERFWEGRKIWGGIVNYSRTWMATSLTLPVESESIKEAELKEIKKRLVYRHVAWLHAIRIQLRQKNPTTPVMNFLARRHIKKLVLLETVEEVISPYLSEEEVKDLISRKNTATHIVKNQARDLAYLRKHNSINGLDHQMLMRCVEESYNLQGKCERIKNTPFPRQYAYFSKVFNYLFVLLVPLGLVHIFHTESVMTGGPLPYDYLLFFVALSVLTIWIFLTWESIGDSTEDPFENQLNDVPMTALTRTIEIDLRDALDEDNLPEKFKAVDDILF